MKIFSHLGRWVSQIVLGENIIIRPEQIYTTCQSKPCSGNLFFPHLESTIFGVGQVCVGKTQAIHHQWWTANSQQVKVYPSTFPCLAGDCCRQAFSGAFSLLPSWPLLLLGHPSSSAASLTLYASKRRAEDSSQCYFCWRQV